MGGSCSLLCFIGCILVCKVILCRTVAFGLCKKNVSYMFICGKSYLLSSGYARGTWRRILITGVNQWTPSPCDQMT